MNNNIGVAVLDTGIYKHIDFGNRIIAFKDFINNRVFPYDDSGHGTHVSGIIGRDLHSHRLRLCLKRACRDRCHHMEILYY